MFSVTRPMIGVWMEDESTVTTVSQGINRPNGANTALNFFGGAMPAELSANKLMGQNTGVWLAGTTGDGDGLVKAAGDEDEDDNGAVGSEEGTFVGKSLGDGGLKGCIGRTTD